jgi:hypothetical protein
MTIEGTSHLRIYNIDGVPRNFGPVRTDNRERYAVHAMIDIRDYAETTTG